MNSEDACEFPGTQVVLFGHTGSGKTTLIINELNKLRRHYLTTSCVESTTVDSLIAAAFDQLGSFYSDVQTTKSNSSLSAELKSQYGFISGLLRAESGREDNTSRKRVIPVQLTPQRLSDFMGNAGHIWIIEAFTKSLNEKKRNLSQILKVFVDAANRYPKFKVICIGAVGTARDRAT